MKSARESEPAIVRRRLVLRLLQRQVAQPLGVSEATITNWETTLMGGLGRGHRRKLGVKHRRAGGRSEVRATGDQDHRAQTQKIRGGQRWSCCPGLETRMRKRSVS